MKNNNARSKIGVLLAVILVIVIAVGAYVKKNVSDDTDVWRGQVSGPHLVLSPLEYDFGTVRQSDGVVSAVFGLYNDGGEQVTITGTPASCSCTSAEVDKKTLAPGERGKLTVQFDPNYHYEDEGRFFRTVAVKSNVSGDAPEAKIWVQVDYDLGKDKLKFPGAEVAE